MRCKKLFNVLISSWENLKPLFEKVDYLHNRIVTNNKTHKQALPPPQNVILQDTSAK